jgi:drug/metabolite transporter (DMT)-like permease
MNAALRFWDGLNPFAKGALMFIFTLFMFSIMDAVAKSLAQRHHPLQVVWARYTSQTVISFIVLAPFLTRLLRSKNLGLQLIRSTFLFGATFCFFTSLKYLQFASATAIFEVAPIFITAASFFILGEKVGLRRWIGVFIGLIGALIIIRPGSEVFSFVALLPVLAAFCFAGFAISTRFLGADESPWTSFLYTTLIGCIASCFMVPAVWETPALPDAGLMISMGITGGIGQYVFIRAFTITEASYLAPFGYVTLLFNAIWGYFFFFEVPDAPTIFGAAIIVGAGVYIWYRETFPTHKKSA